MKFAKRMIPALGCLTLAVFAGAPTTHALGNGGTVTGQVSIKKGRKAKADRSDVVVYLENVEGPGPAQSAKTAVVQRDKQFAPQVSVVVKGEEVDFPNEDKVFHNVFSVSKTARFDLGLYKSGESKSVKMKRGGVVDVYCNIHPDMVAKILVLENGYYDQTGSDGRFSIGNVPPGTYNLVAWQAHGDAFRGTVTVAEGGTAKLDIELDEDSAGDDTHLRKDGTPYGRYK